MGWRSKGRVSQAFSDGSVGAVTKNPVGQQRTPIRTDEGLYGVTLTNRVLSMPPDSLLPSNHPRHRPRCVEQNRTGNEFVS